MKMDSQTVINIAIGLIGTLGGWVMKMIWDAMSELRKDLRQIERDLPEIYVRKDDFRDAVADLKTTMRDGFTKIDQTMGVLFKKLDSKEDKNDVR